MSTLVDTIVDETGASPCVVSALVAISAPIRFSLISFLNTYRAILIGEKARIIGLSTRLDIIEKELGIVIQAGRAALAPYNTLLSTLPFKQLTENCPDVVTQLKQVVDVLPTTIPNSFFTNLLGIADFDVFAGVNDYTSMQKKLNELEFKLQRNTNVSSRISQKSTDIDRALSIIDIYLLIFTKMQ